VSQKIRKTGPEDYRTIRLGGSGNTEATLAPSFTMRSQAPFTALASRCNMNCKHTGGLNMAN